MNEIENKVIQKQSELKDLKLSVESAFRLTSSETSAIQEAAKRLTENGVNIFDNNCNFIKMNDGSLGIFINTSNGMRCILAIKGKDWETTKQITKQLIEYQNNIERRMFLETVQAHVEEQRIILSVKEDLRSMNKSDDEVGKLIYDTYEVLKQTQGAVDAARKRKNNLDSQQEANIQMLQKILDDQKQTLRIITTDFEQLTGWNAEKYKSKDLVNSRKLKDLSRDYTAPLILAKQYSELNRIQGYLADIKTLSADPRYKNGEYPLSQALTSYGIHRLGKAQELIQLLEKNLAIDKKKSDAMMKIAVAQLSDEDFKDLTSYLEASALSVKDPSKEAFVKENMPKVEKIIEKYPELAHYDILNKMKENKIKQQEGQNKENKETQTSAGTTGTLNQSTNSGGRETQSSINIDSNENIGVNNETKKYNNAGEAFAEGGIFGLIDYWTKDLQGKDPRTQQFYRSFGSTVLTIGGIVLGWKVLRNARRLIFGSDEDIKKYNSRGRVLGGAGLLLVTGGRPGELFRGGEITQNLSKMLGFRNGGKNESQTQLINNKINANASPETLKLFGISKTSILFEGMTLGQMAPFISQDSDGKMQINKEDLKNNLIAAKTTANPEELEKINTKLLVLQSLGKDEHNLIDLGLNSLGLTYEQIKDPNNKGRTFNQLAADSFARMGAIGPYMEKNKFVQVDLNDPTKKTALENYIKFGSPSLDELKEAGVFITEYGEYSGGGFVKLPKEYREKQDQEKGKLGSSINTLSDLTDLEKENLLRAGVLFYDAMPTTDKKIEIISKNGKTYFKSYGFETAVNFKDKYIEGLISSDPTTNGYAIKFESYLELLKAANLTNRIKALSKTKQAKSFEPFKISFPGGDIEFDDADIFSTKFDTEIVSAGFGGALKDISSTLEKYKNDYVKYLNTYVEFIKPSTT